MTDVTSTEMSFSWKPPKSDGGRPLLGYIVDRKDSKSPTWSGSEKVNVFLNSPNTGYILRISFSQKHTTIFCDALRYKIHL